MRVQVTHCPDCGSCRDFNDCGKRGKYAYCENCDESIRLDNEVSTVRSEESFEAFCGDDAGQYLVVIDSTRQFPLYCVLCVHDGEVDEIGEFPTAGEALDYLNETGSFGWEGLTCQLWNDTGRLTREGHQA